MFTEGAGAATVSSSRAPEKEPLRPQGRSAFFFGERVSRASVAVTAYQAADFGAQRIVTLRIFNGHIHRLGLLVLTEALVVAGALYAAILTRFATSIDAFEASRGPIWSRA